MTPHDKEKFKNLIEDTNLKILKEEIEEAFINIKGKITEKEFIINDDKFNLKCIGDLYIDIKSRTVYLHKGLMYLATEFELKNDIMEHLGEEYSDYEIKFKQYRIYKDTGKWTFNKKKAIFKHGETIHTNKYELRGKIDNEKKVIKMKAFCNME